eukprot:jgi/Mesvir1/20236/Mv13474-RA.1
MARTKRFPVRAYPGNGVKVHDMTDKLHDAFDAALAKRNKENKPVAEVLSICICCNTLLPIDKFRKVPEDIGGYHTECILCEHMLENNEIDHKPIFPPDCPECGDETAPWAFFPNANWKRELCVNCFFSKEENLFTAPNIPRPVDPCESDPRYNMPLKWQSVFLKGKRPADSPPPSEEPVVKKEKVFRGANPSQRFRAGPSGSNPSMRPCSMKGD